MSGIGPGDADIRLEPGVFWTSGDRAGLWAPRSGWRIRGVGNQSEDVTIALGGTKLQAGTKYHVLGTPSQSVCGFRLENLTLDCGYAENPAAGCNHSGLLIRGSGNLIRGVRVVNWGSRLKGPMGECFGIGMMAHSFNAISNVAEDCEVIEPGGSDSVSGFTGILHSATPPFHTIAPVIRRCIVSNLEGNKSLYSNGVTVYGGLRSSVEDCYVSDVGAGVYMDDAGGQDVRVRNCAFERVRRGISVAFYHAGTRLDAMTIEGNRIILIDPTEGSAFGIEMNSCKMEASGFGVVKASNNIVLAGGDGRGCYLAAIRGADFALIRDNVFVSQQPVTPLIGRNNGRVLLSRNLLGQGGVISYWNEITHETVADPA